MIRYLVPQTEACPDYATTTGVQTQPAYVDHLVALVELRSAVRRTLREIIAWPPRWTSSPISNCGTG